MRRIMRVLGAMVFESIRWILKIIFVVLKLVLGFANIILLLFVMMVKLFLLCVRMGAF